MKWRAYLYPTRSILSPYRAPEGHLGPCRPDRSGEEAQSTQQETPKAPVLTQKGSAGEKHQFARLAYRSSPGGPGSRPKQCPDRPSRRTAASAMSSGRAVTWGYQVLTARPETPVQVTVTVTKS